LPFLKRARPISDFLVPFLISCPVADFPCAGGMMLNDGRGKAEIGLRPDVGQARALVAVVGTATVALVADRDNRRRGSRLDHIPRKSLLALMRARDQT
jgi:hypothetical protein